VLLGEDTSEERAVTDVKDWNSKIIEEFRANEGKVGGGFTGAPMLLLHTTGAKSGKERINPLVYQDVDGNHVIFASKGGAPTHPDWYHNLVANPRVRIEVGDQTVDVQARVAEGEERAKIWEVQKQRMPGFADYEQKTDRQIPVVILEPVG
jgi:deazaflavin-dependent oxidoreductase (nitroreductase family)